MTETKFRTESQSPSGKYRLRISDRETKPGCWGYSIGRVSKLKMGEVQIGEDRWEQTIEVERNYPAFPFLWIEGHVNGHDYLICGSDYQGQTVLELDTGRRKDLLSKNAEEGFGFCWASYHYDAASNLLVVDGCIWACPYEYRFYDFSDPMEKGWTEIPVMGEDGNETYQLADNKKPEIAGDSILAYETEEETNEVLAFKTYRRTKIDGTKEVLMFQSEWVSEKEKENRARTAEWVRRDEEWKANFKATDPLFLYAQEHTKLLPGYVERPYSMGIGVIYDKWCPDYESKGQKERRICLDLIRRETTDGKLEGASINLEWGADTGPIKVIYYRDGKHVEDKFFMEHSVESMQKAFEYIRSVL